MKREYSVMAKIFCVWLGWHCPWKGNGSWKYEGKKYTVCPWCHEVVCWGRYPH